MKLGHLDRYKIELKVLSPLFIGSNEELSPKEYLVTEDGKTCIIPSITKLINVMIGNGSIAAFEAFCAQVNTPYGANKTLAEFLHEQCIPVSPNESWVAYSMPASFPRGSGNTLKKCIKTIDGQPYIPGSSIKSTFRNALISKNMSTRTAEMIMNEIEECDAWSTRKMRDDKENNTLRTLACNEKRFSDGVNDILKGLSISDSTPFSRDSLVVCQKIDLRDDGQENSMPLYRECVKPGQTTCFYLTIDRNILPQLSVDSLMRSL